MIGCYGICAFVESLFLGIIISQKCICNLSGVKTGGGTEEAFKIMISERLNRL